MVAHYRLAIGPLLAAQREPERALPSAATSDTSSYTATVVTRPFSSHVRTRRTGSRTLARVRGGVDRGIDSRDSRSLLIVIARSCRKSIFIQRAKYLVSFYLAREPSKHRYSLIAAASSLSLSFFVFQRAFLVWRTSVFERREKPRKIISFRVVSTLPLPPSATTFQLSFSLCCSVLSLAVVLPLSLSLSLSFRSYHPACRPCRSQKSKQKT